MKGTCRAVLLLLLGVYLSTGSCQETRTMVADREEQGWAFSSWEQIGVGGNGYLTAIATAPLEPPHNRSGAYAVAVGLDCGGPFVSYDQGDSWIPLADGLYPDPSSRYPGFGTEAVAFDPRDKACATLWIATRWDAAQGRILCGREQAGRFVWEERFRSLYPISNIAFAPSRPERVYAAAGSKRSVLNRWGSPAARGRYWRCEPEIYRSDDGGNTWRKSATLPVPGESYGHVFSLAISPDDPDRLYAASDRGVYRSQDGAATWKPIAPGCCAFGLALDWHHPGTIYMTQLAFADLRDLSTTTQNLTGVFRSPDDGRTWQRLPVLDHPPFFAPGKYGSTTQFFDVFAHPVHTERLYVACTGDRDSAVFRSDDSGQSWVRLDRYKPGFNPWFFPQLLALYAPAEAEDHLFVLGATAGHYRSRDAGGGFEPFSSERIGEDADARWRGYGLEADGGLNVAAAGDPNRPDFLLRVDQDRGLSFSDDCGMSFRHVDAPWNEFSRGAWLDPSNPEVIYAICASKFLRACMKRVGGRHEWRPYTIGRDDGHTLNNCTFSSPQ